MDVAKVAEHFRKISSLDPDAVEVWFEGEGYTWGELVRIGDGVGAALAAGGVKPGTPVAWVARNDPAMIGAALGLLMSGNAVCPVNPHVPKEKLASDLAAYDMAAIVAVPADWSVETIKAARDTGAVALSVALRADRPVTVVEGLSRAGAGPHRSLPADVVLERISSGTTGEPKRFPVHAATFVKALDFAATSEPGARSSELSLKRSPAIAFNTFAHSAGFWGVVTALYHGRPIALHDKFTVEGWRDSVRRFKPKALSLMPAMVNMILDANVPAEDLASVIAVRTGSAPLDPARQKQFEDRYGVPILIDYGASEFMGGIATWSLADRKAFGDTKHGSVGRLRPDMEARITDPDTGEILPVGEVGVLNLKTPRHGPDWVATTDLGSIDADGFLFLHGRADEAINRGGFKILPDKVAEVLRLHPGVREAGVVAMKDERLGQVPLAVIEPYPDRAPPTAEDLNAHVRQHMPAYFAPVAYEFVEAMPRTNSMKVSRPGIRELLKDRYAF